MTSGFPDGLDLKPAHWPEDEDLPTPGDPKFFSGQGFLLGGPMAIWPYRGLPSEDYYGAQFQEGNPLIDAPREEASGGTVYFDSRDPETLAGMFRLMGVPVARTEYVAFQTNAPEPVEERYFDHMKLVSHAALKAVFKLPEEIIPPEQTLTMGEALTGFVAAQSEKWGHPHYAFSPKIQGLFGGDGDWAKEALAFGFHAESSYWGICRIWSRAWLVTK